MFEIIRGFLCYVGYVVFVNVTFLLFNADYISFGTFIHGLLNFMLDFARKTWCYYIL